MENKRWLIDVNEFRQIFWEKLQNLKFIGPFDVEHIILNTPKVDAVEVVHGHWIDHYTDIICSECGAEYSDEIVFMNRDFKHSDLNYCPNCGAKMN